MSTSEMSTLLPQGATRNERKATSTSINPVKTVAVLLLATLLVVGCVWMRTWSSSEDQETTMGQEMSVELLGKSKKKKKSSHEKENDCQDGKYSKRTLQLAYELPFVALFRDTKGQTKYEASSVVVVDDTVYAVHDSSWAISKFKSNLVPFDSANVQLGDPNRQADEDSGYEALLEEDGIFYVVRESIQHEGGSYHAIIEELDFSVGGGNHSYNVQQECSCEYTFEGDSKGFEGAVAVHDLQGDMVILGLCEGNFCSETRKGEKGNGRLVAMKKTTLPEDSSSCVWSTIREIHIPSSAFFQDYSAISLNDKGLAVISSQEESQIWIGQLLGQQQENGLWDIDAMEFDTAGYNVYDFPKNHQCQVIYCNIEGVHWINDEMIMAVSDKMKGHGKQDFRCFDKDQSVHVFVLPG